MTLLWIWRYWFKLHVQLWFNPVPSSPHTQMKICGYCKQQKAGQGLGTRLVVYGVCYIWLHHQGFWQPRNYPAIKLSSPVPRPLPDFISQLWRISPRLRDKIWEWPGEETRNYPQLSKVLLFPDLPLHTSFTSCLLTAADTLFFLHWVGLRMTVRSVNICTHSQ